MRRRATRAAAALALALMAPLPRPAAAAVTVSALVRDLGPLRETTDVRCFRAATFAAEPRVFLGMVLERGDRLAGVSGAMVVELACGDAAKRRLSGAFDVIVDEASAGCVLDLKEGDLDVLADTATKVNAGGVVLGNEGTQYALRVGPDGAGLDVLVFDGKVKAWAPKKKEKVESGRSLRIEAGAVLGSKRDLKEKDIWPSAGVYARADIGWALARKVVIPDATAAYERMTKLHYDVLRRPHDRGARLALAEAQEEYGIQDEARYHRQRAEDIKESRIGTTVAALAAAAAAAAIVAEATEDERDDTEDRGEEASDGCAELRRLLAAGSYPEARSMSEGRVRAERASSCDYYALAFIQRRYRQAKEACDSCRRALAAHRGDGRLLPNEVKFCEGLPCHTIE